jgi:predicted permease
MTQTRAWWVTLLGRLIPAAYREEVLADLLEQGLRSTALGAAIVRSARDVRHQIRLERDPHRLVRNLAADIRSAWRMHRARPGSVVAVIAILAMAIGLNTAISSMVDGVLLRPLPFADAERVQFLWTTSNRSQLDSMAPARALDFRARVTAFEHAALIGHISMTVTGRGAAQRWFGASVSSSFFDVVQSSPAIGRTFVTTEPDRDVVVLSHRLWIDEFGGDPAVVGTRVAMNGRLRTVIGVMPLTFYWPSVTGDTSAANPPLFWTCAPQPDVPERPLVFDEDITQNRTMGYLRVVTRLRPDRSAESAREEVRRVAASLAEEFPGTDGGRGAILVPARDQFFGSIARPMWFVLLASALVVLAACVNVGSLILVRQAGRRREFAVRTALGAGRLRLARLLAIEVGMLALFAGALGAVLAQAGLAILVAATPESVGRLDQVVVNGRVLMMTLGISLTTAVLLGALSALALWRDRPVDELRGAGVGEPSRAGLRSIMVGAEVALAVALLVGATLFGQSLWRLQHVDLGLKPDRLLTFDVLLTGERAEYQAQQLDFYARLFERVRTLPGVRDASGAFTLPIGGDDFGASALPEGKPFPKPGEDRRIGFQIIWERWFDTLGMHITAGRDFGPGDIRSAEQVVIINQALADLEWPGISPLGRRLKYAREEDAPWLTIVGVVSDVLHMGPGEPARPEIYLPYRQMTQAMMAVAVRTTGDPMALVPAIRESVAQIDSMQPISGISTMRAHLDKAYGRARFLSSLTMLFAVVAGVLTVVGLYGVTSFAVAQRTREFGVRVALGASPVRLIREVLGASLKPVWFGIAAGLTLAVWTARLAQSLLFGTSPFDVATYVGAAVVIAATAAAASLLPARRAASTDPVEALRSAGS